MEMINHEAYVSLEVAKLLKQACFDWGTLTYYPIDDKVLNERALVGSNVVFNHNRDDSAYSAPTLDVAQRWLREVKGYNVLVCHDFKWNKHGWWILQDNDMLCHNYETQFDTYEEALEAGIKKVLEIILKKGE